MIPDFCPHGSANGGRLLYADLAVPREDALGRRAEPGPDPPEPRGGVSASPGCSCASETDHQIVGSTGFKMPDPYGLGEYKEGLLPHDATPEDILEALHLWAVPEEAHPPVGCSSQVNYQLKYHRGSIQVFLLRQCFVTKPKPCWPSNADFQAMSGMPPSYFSFWGSLEFEIGPVDNPIPPGQNVPHKGYNHSSACMAWGEAKILAGVASKAFMVHWSNHFKMQALPGQQFPPILAAFIWSCWPDVAMEATSMHKSDPDEQSTYPDFEDLKKAHLI